MNRFSIADAWRRRVEEETLFILAAINQTVLTALSKLVAADAVAVDCRWMRQTASGTRFGTQSHAMGTLIGTLTATQLTPNRHLIGMQPACNRHPTGTRPAHFSGGDRGGPLHVRWRGKVVPPAALTPAQAHMHAVACVGLAGARRANLRDGGSRSVGAGFAMRAAFRPPWPRANANRQPPIRAGCATSRRFSRAHPGAASEDRPWAGR